MNKIEPLIIRRDLIYAITWIENLRKKAVKKGSHATFIKECEMVKQQLFDAYKMNDLISSENEQLKKEIAHYESRLL